MAGLDNKISNIIGAAMPGWLKSQLSTRRTLNSIDGQRDDENLKYLANKTAWVRLISSVNITANDLDYFKNQLDPEIRSTLKDTTYLAKNYILYGGTSKYLSAESTNQSSQNPPNYQLRSGLNPDGSYGILGAQEIQNYGYRPMPGITDVRIETQGRLGSVRMATVNFKVWDKAQLDIIDALYFKLGYSMLIEWGNTFFAITDPIKNTSNYHYSELYSIDPFASGQTKESINLQISQNVRQSEGNYDAMLGLVSNFEFNFNQEGGYDCSVKIIGLGTIGESTKINNNSTFPEVAKEQLIKYVETINNLDAQAAAAAKNAELQKAADEAKAKLQKENQQIQAPSYKDQISGTAVNPIQSYTDSTGAYNQEYTLEGSDYGNLFTLTPIKSILADGSNYIKSTKLTFNTSYFNNNIFNPATNLLKYYPAGFWQYLIEGSKNTKIQTGNGVYISPFEGGMIGEINRSVITYSTNKSDVANSGINSVNSILNNKNLISFHPYNEFRNIINEINTSSKKAYFFVYLILGNNDGTDIIQLQDSNGSTVQSKEGSNIINSVNQSLFSNTVNSNIFSDYTKIGKNNDPYSFTSFDSPSTEAIYYDKNIPFIQRKFGQDYNKGGSIEQIILGFLNGQFTDKDSQFELVELSMNPAYDYSGVTTVAPTITMKITINVDAPYFSLLQNGPDGSGNYNNKLTIKKGKLPIVITIQTNDVANIFDVSFKTYSPPESIEYQQAQNALKYQNQINFNNIDPSYADEKTKADQIKTALQYNSNLELALKAVELFALNQATSNFIPSNSGSIESNKVSIVPLASKENRDFLSKLFQEGIFKDFIGDLVDSKIKDDESFGVGESYIQTLKNKEDLVKLKIFSKYGFASGVLGGHETGKTLQNPVGIPPVNYQDLLNVYVVPYSTNPSNEGQIKIVFPTYIQFGFLLMLINDICTIYDRSTSNVDNKNNSNPQLTPPSVSNGTTLDEVIVTSSKKAKKSSKAVKPLVYIDFNPETNLCLSQPTQFSTNAFDFLIPMDASIQDFSELFPQSIIEGNSIKAPSTIKNNKDQTETTDSPATPTPTPLFNPDTDNYISQFLPKFRIENETGGAYKGKTMKVLISIEYLMDTIKEFTKNDGTNSVYLKPFIERILKDMNNYLGTINVFRFAYFDPSNTFAVVDDQIQPLPEGQDRVSNKITDLSDEIPVYGKYSIAKSIGIKTEIGTKLANMIAISANSETKDQAGLGKNASSFGAYNTAYRDRYIPVKNEQTSNDAKPASDSLIDAAVIFNNTIASFYGSDFKPSKENVSQATNFYIDGITKRQNDITATRASMMIPVSVNFSMDGIAGFHMGQAFTIPERMLPYTYTSDRLVQNSILNKKVGFATVGLSHNISSNTWTTDVKGQMIFLKDDKDFSGNLHYAAPNAKTQSYGGFIPPEISSQTGWLLKSLALIRQEEGLSAMTKGKNNYYSTSQVASFLKQYEANTDPGISIYPYPDLGYNSDGSGKGTWTIGFGSTSYIGNIVPGRSGNIKPTDGPITYTQAENLMRAEVNGYCKNVVDKALLGAVTRPSDTQYAVLISHVYNTGNLNNVQKYLKAGDSQSVANALAGGPTTAAGSNGQSLGGLISRRQQESALYLAG